LYPAQPGRGPDRRSRAHPVPRCDDGDGGGPGRRALEASTPGCLELRRRQRTRAGAV